MLGPTTNPFFKKPSTPLVQLGEQLTQLGEQFAQLGEKFAQLGEQFAQLGEQLRVDTWGGEGARGRGGMSPMMTAAEEKQIKVAP